MSAALLRQVNEAICEKATLGMFVTLVAGYLDPRSGRLELANARQHPALLHRADGHFVEFPAPAPPLGVLADMHFPAAQIHLDDGVLYLYTDGISERAQGTVAELGALGRQRLIDTASVVAADQRLDAIVSAWRAAGFQAHDDITLMLVEIPSLRAGVVPGFPALRFGADATELKRVREYVAQVTRQFGLPSKLVNDLVIAVNEACMNVIEHAYKRDSAGEIVLEIYNNHSDIEIVLTDFAPPVDIDAIRARDLEELRPGGLGTHFMAALMDSCVYAHLADRRGNVLRMSKRLDV